MRLHTKTLAAIVVVACGRTSDRSGGQGSAGPPLRPIAAAPADARVVDVAASVSVVDPAEPPPADRVELPRELAAWMPANAEGAWQGAFVLWLHRGRSTIEWPVAVELRGDVATIDDGRRVTRRRFQIDAPCAVRFAEQLSPTTIGYDGSTFLLDGSAIRAGNSMVGMRRGRAAIACIVGRTVTIDDRGTCFTWQITFDRRWKRKPARCRWKGDALVISALIFPDDEDVLAADGDRLISESFRRDERARPLRKVADLAAARIAAKADRAPIDPSERAKAAGGVPGDTKTVAGLQATWGTDQRLLGKPLEVRATLVGIGTMTAGSNVAHNYTVSDRAGGAQPTILCTSATRVDGLSLGAKVVVRGTVYESFGEVALSACTLALAP